MTIGSQGGIQQTMMATSVQPFNQQTVDYESPEMKIATDAMNKDLDFPLNLQELTTEQQREIADRIYYYESKDYLDHQKNCEANRDYFFNKQWTKAETDENVARGQYTIVINKVRKAISAMAGLFSANKPRYSVMPSGKEDVHMAAVANKLLDYIWYKSDGLNTVRNVCVSGLRDNVGYFIVSVDLNGDVKFDYADYTMVVVDPKSRDQLFRDSEWIYLKKWVPISTIKELYGIDVNASQRTSAWQNRYSSNTQENVKVGQLIDDHEMHCCVYEGQKITWVKQTDGSFRKSVRKQTVLGYKYVYNQILPESITERSIIPFYTEFTGNPYVKGEIFFLKEYQDFLNKSFGVTLMNAQLHGNPKVFMWDKTLKASVEDVEQGYSKPGSITVLNSEEGQGTNLENLKPIIVQGQPLPSAWFQLMQMVMSEMEMASMPNDVLGYKDSTSQQVQMLFEKREAVMDSLKLALGHFDNALVQLGIVNLQYAKAYMNKKKMFRVIDGEGKTFSFLQDLQRGFDPKDEGLVARYRDQQRKQGISDIDIEKDLAKARNDADYAKAIQLMYSDIDAMDVDLTMVAGSYSPNYEASQWSALMMMRQSGVAIDDEDVIAVSPIQDRSVIAAKSSQNAKLVAQNRALHEEIQVVTTQLHELQQSILQLEYENQIIEGQGKVNKAVTEARYKLKNQVSSEKYQVQSRVKDAQHNIEKAQISALNDIIRLVEVIKNSPQAANATLAEMLSDPSILNLTVDPNKPFSSSLRPVEGEIETPNIRELFEPTSVRPDAPVNDASRVHLQPQPQRPQVVIK